MNARDWPRGAGALVLGTAGAALLRIGGAEWGAAVSAGAAATLFVVWRTVPGACTAFALLLVSADAAWINGARALGALPALWPWALALECYGLLTILAVALVRDPRRVSRRLLGSWLASTGIGVLGLALCADASTRAIGSALVAGTLAYRIGVVPAYAWAPLLLRHPSARIEAVGALGLVLAGAVLARAASLLPDRAAAGHALGVLAVVTLPWAVWRAVHQRLSDPRCARTYVVVALVACVVLVAAMRLTSS